METSDSQPTAREQKGKKIKAAANSGLWRAEPAPSGTCRPRGTTSGTAPVSVPSGAGSGRRLFLLTALYLMGPPGRARGRRPGACFPGRSGHPPGTRSASPQGLGGAGRTARGRTRSGAHCLQSHVPGGGVSVTAMRLHLQVTLTPESTRNQQVTAKNPKPHLLRRGSTKAVSYSEKNEKFTFTMNFA